MDIRVPDYEALVRSAYLLASLDRKRFSAEQLEVIDAGILAAEESRKRKEEQMKYKTAYVMEKRKSDPTYSMSARAKASRGKPKGRPKKNPANKE